MFDRILSRKIRQFAVAIFSAQYFLSLSPPVYFYSRKHVKNVRLRESMPGEEEFGPHLHLPDPNYCLAMSQ